MKWVAVVVSVVILLCLSAFLYLRWFIVHHTRVAMDKAASVTVSELGDALKRLKAEVEQRSFRMDMTAYLSSIDLQYLCGPYYGWAGTEACCDDVARIRIRIVGDEVWGCSLEGAPAGDDGSMRTIYRVKLYGGDRLPPMTGSCFGKTFCDIHNPEAIIYSETMLNRDCTFRKPRAIKSYEVGSVREPTIHLVAEKTSAGAMGGTKPSVRLPYPLVPLELIKQVDQRGPIPVVRELFERDEDWRDVLRNVARGDPEWLEVAARLREGSDAHCTEELVEAVRSALAESAERVLELTRRSFRLDEICRVPLFDVDATSRDQVIAVLDRRIKALDRVKRPDLLKERERCQELTRGSVREIRQTYEPTKPE
jgi:hypothetical protein